MNERTSTLSTCYTTWSRDKKLTYSQAYFPTFSTQFDILKECPKIKVNGFLMED
ncbi:hypothetical protein RYX36_026289 [Vicia faba]